jgi:hypothetical protein
MVPGAILMSLSEGEYADVVWDNCPNYIKEKLEHINYEAARIITGATKLTSIRILLQETKMFMCSYIFNGNICICMSHIWFPLVSIT